MRLNFYARAVATLLLALAAAELCVWLATPIPWMIGPLLATAIASIGGAPTASAGPLRNAGQWVIGAALGLYFTPQVTALVAGLWWAIVVAIVWALLLGTGFGLWLQRVHAPRMPELRGEALRATTYYAGAIGAASEMTLLAERKGARADLVAAAHSMRLLIVVLVIPFAMQWGKAAWGLQAIEFSPPGPKTAQWPGFLWLALATGAGALLMDRFGRANPWFMGALLVGMGFTMAGIHLTAIPTGLSNAAQLVIGVSLGVRFSAEFVHTAPRWLASVALGTVVMIVLCAGLAGLLARGTGLPLATMILGVSPGGISEMAITAKVLQLGVPVVTAFQVCRLVAVLLLVDPLYRWVYRARAQGS